jgi:hypothetical protein
MREQIIPVVYWSMHWIGTSRVLVHVVVPGKLGGRQWRRKPEKQAKHGTKYKAWQPTGPDRGISRMPYATEEATGIK